MKEKQIKVKSTHQLLQHFLVVLNQNIPNQLSRFFKKHFVDTIVFTQMLFSGR